MGMYRLSQYNLIMLVVHIIAVLCNIIRKGNNNNLINLRHSLLHHTSLDDKSMNGYTTRVIIFKEIEEHEQTETVY